jgi:hypothetical protein
MSAKDFQIAEADRDNRLNKIERKKKRAEKKQEADRIAEAIDYKLQGHPYETIAEQMKVSVKEAARLVREGLTTLVRDPADQQILLDLQRIDQMLAAIYPTATQGDRDSINTVLALRRERDELQKKWHRQESFRTLAPEED